MFREVKTEMSYSTSTVPASDKIEKSSIRTRGSSSPFRCISNIVQQMNQERDQELSAARLRVEELEALAASRQKEVFNLFCHCPKCRCLESTHQFHFHMMVIRVLNETSKERKTNMMASRIYVLDAV